MENQMKVKEKYDDFSNNYDLFGTTLVIDEVEKEFFEKIFSQYDVESVLDCACGTGVHCYLLSEMGYDIKGSDLSNGMLKKAKENLKKVNSKIDLRQCDFRKLDNSFEEKFDAVLCLTTSLPHLHKKIELIKALKSMKSVLKEDGIVIVDQGITHNSLKNSNCSKLIVNNREYSRIFVKDINEDMQITNILDIYHGKKNKIETFTMEYKILLDDDYRELLKEAGFKNIKIYGDYNLNEYDSENSNRIIAIAKKNS